MENKFLENIARSLNVELPYRENLKEYLQLILPEIQSWSEDISERNFYSSRGGKPWMEIRDEDNFNSKVLHFFNDQSEYIRSVNGDITRGKWRYMGDTNKFIIELGGGGGGGGGSNKGKDSGGGGGGGSPKSSELFDLAYLDANFFILKKSGRDKYFFMGREGLVGGLEWRDCIELLFNNYRNRHKNYQLAVGAILVIVVIVILLSVF
ncbi:MAG: hypothetical protein KDC44_21490 [Phaeodactylibacter sp.]|nr:hypothetical protein [Phaeodactylibacter sp.]